MADSTESVATTWNNTISAYFTPKEAGCMRGYGFDLSNYSDVMAHTIDANGAIISTSKGIYKRQRPFAS